MMYTDEELEKHEKARNGTLKCKDCNSTMFMYYKPICPECNKPYRNTLYYYNLLHALYILEHRYKGAKKEIWELLISEECIDGNDSFLNYFPDQEVIEESYGQDILELCQELYEICGETYGNDIKWWVSW